MMIVSMLFLAGVLLLSAEIFLPGGIAGIFGALFLSGGVAYSFVHYGSPEGWWSAGLAITLVAVAIWLEFWLIPRTAWGRRLLLQTAVDGVSHPAPAGKADLIGREAIVTSPLFPTGTIEIDGISYEAFSQDGSVDRGVTVRVVGKDSFRIIVTTKPSL